MKVLISLLVVLCSVSFTSLSMGQMTDATMYGQDPAKSTKAPIRYSAALDNISTSVSLRKMPTLPCRATAAAPSWTEALAVPCSVDLSGNLRISGTFTSTSTLVAGTTAHDAGGVAVNPVAIGCYSGAAAHSDVNADIDVTQVWCLRNGAIAFQPTYNGNLAVTDEGVATVGTPRVVDASTRSKTAAAPDEVSVIGGAGSGATNGLVAGVTVCDTFANVNIVTATTTLIVTGVSGRHVRICSLGLVTSLANNVALISGTGATCGTGTTAMSGGTTAATGWNFAVNGGITQGSGLGEINRTNATGDSVCIVSSSTGQLSGRIAYAIY